MSVLEITSKLKKSGWVFSTGVGQVMSVVWGGGRQREVRGLTGWKKHVRLCLRTSWSFPRQELTDPGNRLPGEERVSSAFQLPSLCTPPFPQWSFPTEIEYGLGVGQGRGRLGARLESGEGRGGRLRKEKQLELVSWGLAKKEAPGPGKWACLPPHNPPLGFLSLCDSRT